MLNYQVVPIPVDFSVPPVNSILIYSDPLTIIDPGPKHPRTRKIWSEALGQKGLALKDVRRILLSHGHVDHFGIAQEIVDESGADVFIHPADKNKVLPGRRAYRDKVMKALLRKQGVPAEFEQYIDQFTVKSEKMLDSLPGVADMPGEIIFEDGELRVWETPGHSAGSVVFFEEATKTLFSGDTLLKYITPNPVFEENEAGVRFQALKEFRQTLVRLSDYEFRNIIPGHGEWIEDYGVLRRQYEAGWQKRKEKIGALIEKNKVITSYELARLLFRQLDNFNIFLAISEIVGYLDWLVEDGEIALEEVDGIIKIKSLTLS